METFKDRLLFLMKREGIKTQYNLARRLNVKLNILNKWVTGNTGCPEEKYLDRISKYFYVTKAWLRYGDEKLAPTTQDYAMRLVKKVEKYPEIVEQLETLANVLIRQQILREEKEAEYKKKSAAG